jgi:hypothetical protein
MNSRTEENQPNNKNSRWPTSEMLARGTFGTGTAAEKRLISRNRIVLGVIVAWILVGKVTHMQPKPVMGSITVFLPAALCTYYALQKRKYFLSLDELTRRIELEGMAWAYSLGVLTALWVGGVGYVVSLYRPLDAKLLSWEPFFLFAIVLATIKGTYRYFATRRY